MLSSSLCETLQRQSLVTKLKLYTLCLAIVHGLILCHSSIRFVQMSSSSDSSSPSRSDFLRRDSSPSPKIQRIDPNSPKQTPSSKHHSPQSTIDNENPVIATLVTNSPKDISNLCTALQSLRHLPDTTTTTTTTTNHPKPLTPVLIFNEGNLLPPQILHLQTCTNRSLHFPLVPDFSTFPPDFNPRSHTPNWTKRSTWGYQHMIRFWTFTIWNHDALTGYTSVMRLDSDACYTSQLKESYLPGLPNSDIRYVANYYVVESHRVCDGLWDLAIRFLQQEGIDRPANPELWDVTWNEWKTKKICVGFYNNFEVVRVSLMQSPQMMRWAEMVANQEPFGIYRFRWGDALVRFLGVVMLLPRKHWVERNGKMDGYEHPCGDDNLGKVVVPPQG